VLGLRNPKPSTLMCSLIVKLLFGVLGPKPSWCVSIVQYTCGLVAVAHCAFAAACVQTLRVYVAQEASSTQYQATWPPAKSVLSRLQHKVYCCYQIAQPGRTVLVLGLAVAGSHCKVTECVHIVGAPVTGTWHCRAILHCLCRTCSCTICRSTTPGPPLVCQPPPLVRILCSVLSSSSCQAGSSWGAIPNTAIPWVFVGARRGLMIKRCFLVSTVTVSTVKGPVSRHRPFATACTRAIAVQRPAPVVFVIASWQNSRVPTSLPRCSQANHRVNVPVKLAQRPHRRGLHGASPCTVRSQRDQLHRREIQRIAEPITNFVFLVSVRQLLHQRIRRCDTLPIMRSYTPTSAAGA